MGLTFNLGRVSPSVFTDSSLNVGIGGSPSGSYKLEVTGTAKVSSTLLVSGAATFGSSINSGAIQATASGAVIQLIGLASSNAYYVNDQTANSGKRWRFGHTGAVSGYNTFDFYNQTNDLLAMTITSAGNVGIGTGGPTGLLELSKTNSGGVGPILFLRNSSTTATGNATQISFAGNAGGDATTPTAKIVCTEASNAAATMAFHTYNGATTAERMRIESTGLVKMTSSVGSYGQLQLSSSDTEAGIGFRFVGDSDTASWVIGKGIAGIGTTFGFYYAGTKGTLTTGGVWSTTGGGTSDLRTKQDVDYDFDNGIESIIKLQPTKFKFKIAPNSQRRGFIAQDVLQVIPDLVLGDGELEDGTYGLDYDGILAIAVKAIQELNEKLVKNNIN